jgi:isopenicillin-N N-acyltransferase-like protein
MALPERWSAEFTMKTIPFIKVRGDHFEVGRQLGAATAHILSKPVPPPAGRTWAEMRHLALPYQAVTEAALPWLHQEMAGIAEGSGLDLLDLYVHATEEIWTPAPELSKEANRCSDFAVGPPATMDGGIWLAHNNDLDPAVQDDLMAIEWQVEDQPSLFTLGIGPFISIGFNAAGLALTGNELSPNDERIGVPRLLIVRDILAQSVSAQALAAAARPERASSYNQLISHVDGTIVNFEGSATNHELIYARNGWTVHTNHYCSKKMQKYELEPETTEASCLRYNRAQELMETHAGPVTPAILKIFLSDHVNAPYSICRHGPETQTLFWAIIDLSHKTIEYGYGQPCQSASQHFSLI